MIPVNWNLPNANSVYDKPLTFTKWLIDIAIEAGYISMGVGITDGDKGDITVSIGGTVWTIDPLSITDSKINDVAWSKISGTPSTLAGYNITDAYPLIGNPLAFINQAGARTAISLTTVGTSGAATYNSGIGVINIPNYTFTGVSSVSGTLDRITSTGGTTPVIDISSSYVGQSSITTLGTVTTGIWNASVIGTAYGGSPWTITGSDIYYNTGNVSIGNTSPTSKLDITTNAIGTSQTNTSGLTLINNTAATALLMQSSPAIRWRGSGWKSNATAASQTVDFRAYVFTTANGPATIGALNFQSSINGGAYTDLLSIESTGDISLQLLLANNARIFGYLKMIDSGCTFELNNGAYILLNGSSGSPGDYIENGGLGITPTWVSPANIPEITEGIVNKLVKSQDLSESNYGTATSLYLYHNL